MRLETRGEYPADWPELASQTRAAAGHRCIRCGHRFVTLRDAQRFRLEPSPGQWSPCDERCTHDGAVRVWAIVEEDPGESHWWETDALRPVGELVAEGARIEAAWRVLTVHHLDGDKANSRWWNLLALCQVCHLSIQARVIPERPWLFGHTPWFRPYVAGFYASYYAKQDITRAEAEAELDRWLALNPACLEPAGPERPLEPVVAKLYGLPETPGAQNG